MIEKEKTFERFGYHPEELSKGSNRKIIASCDYCKSEIITSTKNRTNNSKIVDKDCCMGCRHKKAEEVNLKKYGVKNQFQRKENKKISSEWVSSDEFKNKARKTNLERYGTEAPMRTQKVQDNLKRTMMDKYGVAHSAQMSDHKDKVQSTLLEKYGVKCGLLTETAKQALKDKYGVDNVFQSEEIKEKIRETHLRKRGVTHHFKDKGKAKENADKVVQSKIRSGNIKLYNGKTISELRELSEYSNTRFRALIHQYGYDMAMSMTPRESSLEQAMAKFLSDCGIDFVSRKKSGKYYPDFIIGNLIIECDGLYWHSDAAQPDDNYHVKKRKDYTEMGYRSLFFREDELRDKSHIVQSIILNALNMCPVKYFARKLDIKEISFKEGNEFIRANHLMGGTTNISNSFGLYNSGDLVSVLQMKRTKGNTYDIARFCNSVNTSIVGGFSRLLKLFRLTYKPDKIFTFIDMRYGTGDYLPDLGFECVSNYKSFCWTDYVDTYHRLKFRGNSGYELGLNKIWDCGQARFEYK